MKEAYDNDEDKVKMYGPSVSVKEGRALARKIRALGYFETSAITGKGINEAFDAILESAIESRREHNPSDNCCATKCF